ncbi:hypothetical protein FJY69_00500 [candidate division WOR-3 bacterium]|nr:hypothetical protein [candidate division WOR-3 bacterium]
MAQGSKSRVVIWAIVGILVVIAVVFLIVGRKGTPGGKRAVAAEDIPTFIGRMEDRVVKFEGRVARAREKGGDPAAFAKIDEQVAKVRTGMQELQGITDQTQWLPKMESIKDALGEARKMLREAGGEGGADED